MGWLKAEALVNIFDISVTLLTSQDPMGWLKAEALNILLISVIRVVTILLNGIGAELPGGVK